MDTDCRRADRSVIGLALVVVGAGFLAAPLAPAAPDAAVHPLARRAVAGGAEHGRVAQDIQRGDARA